MTPNRKPAKSTPSPVTLRDRVLKNCLSEIRSKRSSMVQQYRTQTAETRNELMKAFVSEIYSVTKREKHQPQLTVSDEMDQQTEEDEYLQSAEHRELLSQIADAIAFELEHAQETISEEQLFEMEEFEESARIEMLDSSDDNTIICPLCRFAIMYISDEAGTASCPCGALINLHCEDSYHNSNQNSQECDYGYTSPSSSCTGNGIGNSYGTSGGDMSRSKSVISAAELKQRLGSVHDRHNAICEQYHQQHAPYSVFHTTPNTSNGISNYTHNTNNTYRPELEYQIFGGHLCTYCAECSFCEQIT